MKTARLPGMEKPVSRVIMGTMIIGTDNYAESAALLDAAYARGVNAFDLAYVYGGGKTERAVGRWVAERGNREGVYIATKGAHHNEDRQRVTPYDITADLMDSLARLKTDYIDAYLLHRDDMAMPVGPIMDALHEHRKAGRIRAFGGSNWTHGRIAEANAYAAGKGQYKMELSSPNFSLCEQVEDPWGPGCVTIGGAGASSAREFYAKSGIPVLAYSSLGRGMLSGRTTRENYKETLDGAALKAYAHECNFARLDRANTMAMEKGVTVPQIALAYLLNQPFQVFPIVGAAGGAELDEAVAAADIPLTDRELRWLEG